MKNLCVHWREVLKEMGNNTATVEKKYYTSEEVAVYLGAAYGTIRNWIHQGKFTVLRLGPTGGGKGKRFVRISKEELERFEREHLVERDER